MVKICDAIMGSGKTTAAINYINEHPRDKYLYITPYLDEVYRIKKECRGIKFYEPLNSLSEFSFRKASHTRQLLEEGKNIVTTHQNLKNLSPDVFSFLAVHGYTVFIDEEINTLLEGGQFDDDDIRFLEKAGVIRGDGDGSYEWMCDDFGGKAIRNNFGLFITGNIVDITNGTNQPMGMYYWMFNRRVFQEARLVIIMTYLFDGSQLDAYLHMNGIEHETMGVEMCGDGKLRFSDTGGYVPEYVHRLKELISVESDDKINRIGDKYHAMSMNWYRDEKRSGEHAQIKKNVYNFFNNRMRGHPADERMCGYFKGNWKMISGKGYGRSDVVFCERATNKYRNRRILAYPVNIFVDSNIKNYYTRNGNVFNPERYALSIMIQWIWRSAIRDGKEIWLYVPAKRMRMMLLDWMDEVVAVAGEAGG